MPRGSDRPPRPMPFLRRRSSLSDHQAATKYSGGGERQGESERTRSGLAIGPALLPWPPNGWVYEVPPACTRGISSTIPRPLVDHAHGCSALDSGWRPAADVRRHRPLRSMSLAREGSQAFQLEIPIDMDRRVTGRGSRMIS
jgi:hypothetical protein